MLEGRDLILATRQFAKEDRNKSWFHLLSTFFLLLLSYSVVFLNIPLGFKFIFGFITGLLIVRMFVIYHDYLHEAILQKSFIANVIFTFFGLYILAPKSIWKRSHDYHHNHNSKLYSSSIGSFPIVTKKKFLSAKKGEQNMYLFIRHPLTISLGYVFAFIYGMCIRSLLSSPAKHWDSFISLIFHFGIGIVIFQLMGWESFLAGFILPSLVSSAIGSYLFYAQHNFPDATFEDKDGWTYLKAALESSSYMKMSFVMQWVTANIGYHHIHHVNSRIPFYRLPEVYQKMPEFQNAKLTSLKFSDVIQCFKLKVWDPEKQKMIGFKELYKKSAVPSKSPAGDFED